MCARGGYHRGRLSRRSASVSINLSSMEQSLRCGAALGEQAIQVVGTDLSAEAWRECREHVSKIMK